MNENHEDVGETDLEVPQNSADLMPSKLYLMEVLLLPVFWLAPALVAGLGWMMSRDAGKLNEQYGVKIGDMRYLLYLAPITIGHFGSLGYRGFRRQQITKELGLEPSAASRLLKQDYNSSNYALVGWFVLQILVVIVLVALPMSAEVLIDITAFTALAVFGLNVIVGPALIWWDLRRIQSVESVEWGCSRYLHILLGTFPFAMLVYLVQRMEHLYYSMLVDVWETPVEELQIEEEEKTRLERFSDSVNETFSF